jgi:hypothetical protein
LPVSHRPLALVCGLTLGDYLLWNWSLGGDREVLALIAGLSLPPLLAACMLMLLLSVARLLARARRLVSLRRTAPQPRRLEVGPKGDRKAGAAGADGLPAAEQEPASTTVSSPTRSSGKLAA